MKAATRKFLPVSSPTLGEDEIAEVVEVMRSGWIGTGKKVQLFEEALSRYLGTPHAIALSSCTAALHLSLLACGVEAGDEVITTPMTFASTANVVVHVGATPIFVDIRRRDFNIDPEQIERHITKRSKAIMPVHFAGLPCDMREIQRIADAHGIPVIEDAAHAIGATYGGKKIGASGNFVCFSFYPTKNITTIEGGLLCTSDDKAAKLVKILRMHGQSADAWKRFSSGSAKSYKVVEAGFKYNMTDVQAAVGLKQIEKIDKLLESRKGIADFYSEELKHTPGVVLPIPDLPGRKRVWYVYCILVKKEELGIGRDALMARLAEKGIGTGVHFEALSTQPYYQERFGYKAGMFPEAEYVSERTLSLPVSASMTEEDAMYVADTLKATLTRGP